jgi:hypothetical protein
MQSGHAHGEQRSLSGESHITTAASNEPRRTEPAICTTWHTFRYAVVRSVELLAERREHVALRVMESGFHLSDKDWRPLHHQVRAVLVEDQAGAASLRE